MSFSRTPEAESDTHRRAKALLLVGFAGLTCAVVIAHLSPADGYEVSIYRSTPLAFWGALAVGYLAGVTTCLLTSARRYRVLGAALVALGTLWTASLPLLRGYHFYGIGDSMTHLGWARAISQGDLAFTELVYPGGHTLGVFLSQLAAVDITRGLMMVVIVMVALYLLFVPLILWVLRPDTRLVAIGAVLAAFLLPINNISTGLHFHSYTLSTLFFPFVLYLLFMHVLDGAGSRGKWRLTAASFGLFVATAAVLFFHPQVALNVLILFGTIILLILYGRLRNIDALAGKRTIFLNFLFLAVIFVVWNGQHESAFDMARNMSIALSSFLQTGGGGAEVVSERSQSAAGVGTSLVEIFLRVFLIHAIAFALAAWYGLSKLVDLKGLTNSDPDSAAVFFAASGLTLGPFFVLHFLGDVSKHFFRHFGFAMVIITIMAALALYKLTERSSRSILGGLRTPVTVAVVLVALVLTQAVVFPAPYSYRPTQHVTDYQVSGYESTFDYQPAGAAIAGVGSVPNRYADALDRDLDKRLRWNVGPDNITRLRSFRGSDFSNRSYYYFVLTRTDREQELVAYRGIRFTSSELTGFESQPRVSRVLSNGNYRMYYVDQSEADVVGDTQAANIRAERLSAREPSRRALATSSQY